MPGSKPGALTAWRRPCIETLHRIQQWRPIDAASPGGNAASAASADSRVANSTKQPLPDPVRRGVPMRARTANKASTAGSRRRSTGSKALPGTAALPSAMAVRKSDIFAGAAFRVKSGAWNSPAVAAWTPGLASTYQAGGRSIGARRSPTPSAQALRPCTNTGTSAPSRRPRAASRSRPKCSPHNWSRATSTVAASDEPPPKPPPIGTRFSMPMSTPCLHLDSFCRSFAARTRRSSASETPAAPAPTRATTASARGRRNTVSPQSSRRNTVCRSW